MLTPEQYVLLRQQVMTWAMSTAHAGEAAASVLERSSAYLEFILAPLQPAMAAAIRERLEATIH